MLRIHWRERGGGGRKKSVEGGREAENRRNQRYVWEDAATARARVCACESLSLYLSLSLSRSLSCFSPLPARSEGPLARKRARARGVGEKRVTGCEGGERGGCARACAQGSAAAFALPNTGGGGPPARLGLQGCALPRRPSAVTGAGAHSRVSHAQSAEFPARDARPHCRP